MRVGAMPWGVTGVFQEPFFSMVAWAKTEVLIGVGGVFVKALHDFVM
jgi:hypothetical protein